MGFLAEAAGLFGSAGAGAVTGLIGTAVGAYNKNVERKAKRLELRDEREHELKLLRLQAQRDKEEHDREADLRELEAQVKVDLDVGANYRASLEHSTSIEVPSGHWVQIWRASIRPGLTTYSWIALWSLLVFLVIRDYTIPSGTIQEQLALTLIYNSSTFATWWFGNRAITDRR